MYDVYIFDLDGTLLDTLDDLTVAVNFALRSVGAPERSREEVRSFVGNGIVKLMERALPNGECGGGQKSADFTRAFEEFKGYYAEHCADRTRVYDGVLPLLEALKGQGKLCAIASNKAEFAVKELSKRYFGRLIDVAAGENEAAGIRKKPAPDSVFAVIEKLNARGKRVVYVGDSEVDIETARNAALPCVSVTWGFKTREFLLENGAQTLVDEPKEILSL